MKTIASMWAHMCCVLCVQMMYTLLCAPLWLSLLFLMDIQILAASDRCYIALLIFIYIYIYVHVVRLYSTVIQPYKHGCCLCPRAAYIYDNFPNVSIWFIYVKHIFIYIYIIYIYVLLYYYLIIMYEAWMPCGYHSATAVVYCQIEITQITKYRRRNVYKILMSGWRCCTHTHTNTYTTHRHRHSCNLYYCTL